MNTRIGVRSLEVHRLNYIHLMKLDFTAGSKQANIGNALILLLNDVGKKIILIGISIGMPISPGNHMYHAHKCTCSCIKAHTQVHIKKIQEVEIQLRCSSLSANLKRHGFLDTTK